MLDVDLYLAQARKCERDAAVTLNADARAQLIDLACELRRLARLYGMPGDHERATAPASRPH